MARGGMSVVWRGQDELLGRPVAVKILSGDLRDASFAERVRREAKAVARLSHPHIATVYDYGESREAPKPPGRPANETTPYIVMELVEGESLAKILKRGPLSWPTAVGVCAQVAAALAAAHQYGVVHRDITPNNIMISADGVKVIDFGVAATTGDRTDGAIIGTPAYLAPERLSGGVALPATDVYGLGIVLYESLCGRLPWAARSTAAMITAHQYIPPAPVPPIEGLPEQVTRLCQGCLSVDPRQRPGSGRAYVLLAEAARQSDGRHPAAWHSATRANLGPNGTRVLARLAHEPVDTSAATVQIEEKPAPRRRGRDQRRAGGGCGADRDHERDHGGVFILPALLLVILLGCFGLSGWRAGDGATTHQPRPAPSTRAPVQAGPAQEDPKLPDEQPPSAPKVLADTPRRATAACRVSYRTTASRSFGYAALVTIANTSPDAIAGWTLRFTLPRGEQISSGWNGRWEQDGRHVTVTGVDYDSTLSPGAAVSIGFRGRTQERVGQRGVAEPGVASGFQLNGHACAEF